MTEIIKVELIYFQNIDRTWDSYHHNKMIVNEATSLAQAQVFSEVLLGEEYDYKYKIVKEIIHYYNH